MTNTIYNSVSFAATVESTQMRFDRARNSQLTMFGNRVLKTAKEGQIEREFDMLTQARACGINVPHVAEVDSRTLSLQFIPNGQTLFDYINHGKLNKALLNKVIAELRKFWAAGFVHGDLHMNNILINEITEEVFIIDLASSFNEGTLEAVFGADPENAAEVRKGQADDLAAFKRSFKEAQAVAKA